MPHTHDFDRLLYDVRLETEDFQERYMAGSQISHNEWVNMSHDWLVFFYASVQKLFDNRNVLTLSQAKELEIILQDIRGMKKAILEIGYEYPDFID